MKIGLILLLSILALSLVDGRIFKKKKTIQKESSEISSTEEVAAKGSERKSKMKEKEHGWFASIANAGKKLGKSVKNKITGMTEKFKAARREKKVTKQKKQVAKKFLNVARAPAPPVTEQPVEEEAPEVTEAPTEPESAPETSESEKEDSPEPEAPEEPTEDAPEAPEAPETPEAAEDVPAQEGEE
ncbi:unnamed protein product [Caenorhabditis angaria]|uniref:Uncharacterized protein n=1 Tax=Caenorhabditis angaria TaxID=860376 RepID=A0A9P1I6R3_9PELO|nr:unnamed protein product [Caenorhabditis angaria]